MPRVTPCRVLKVLSLPWIVMIGMWFFLPSPAVPSYQREAYIQNRFASGKTVIMALEYTPFLRHPGRIYSGECSECSDVLVHWRLIKSGDSSFLSSGFYEDRTIDMTKILRDAVEYNTQKQNDQNWAPYFSDPLSMNVPGGDLDEEINMPWFQVTDQKLIHYNMHNFETSIAIRAVVPEPGVLEIWRNAYVEPFLDATSQEQAKYDTMRLNVSETDYLASFQFGKDPRTSRVIVKHLAGELPSRTYPIRRALLVPLGPFIAIPFILIQPLFDLISPYFNFIVVWFGLLVGLVSYRRMRQSGSISSLFGGLCWPLQFIRRRQRKNRAGRGDVWGPSGPVDTKTHRNWFDEERLVGLQRPDTARLGRNWKA
jgi:hypothetical protein